MPLDKETKSNQTKIYDQQIHQAYIPGDLAKSDIGSLSAMWTMTSIDEHHTSYGSCTTSPSPKSLLWNRPRVKSCLLGGIDKYPKSNQKLFVSIEPCAKKISRNNNTKMQI